MKTLIHLGLVAMVLSQSCLVAQSVLVGTVKEPGLSVTTIQTEAGQIKVYLPENISAGERISGTVTLRSTGKTTREQEKNQAYLNGCVLELEDEARSKSSAGVLRFAAPMFGPTLFALLKDQKGSTLSRFPIPVQPARPLSSNDFVLPSLGQNSSSLFIPGPADGDLSNSSVRIGQRGYQPLAESPHGMVIRPAADAETGLQAIAVQDGGKNAGGSIRLVAVQLQAERLGLKRHESTTLRASVSGLQNLAEPLSLHLCNETPGNIRMNKGDVQHINISSTMVDADGVFRTQDVINSFGLGDFSISARVTLKDRKLNCSEKLDIYSNFSGGDKEITVEVTDECKTLNSLVTTSNGKQLEIPDKGANSGTFKLRDGDKITLDCKGTTGGNCTYTLTIH
jgi:hypothetical protein